MKAQAIQIAPSPVIHEITVTIDKTGRPQIVPENMSVKTGDFVQWNCNLNATGRLSVSFDPFHSVFTEGTVVAIGQTVQFGPYAIAIDPGATGNRTHPYHVGWTPTGSASTIYVDPVIIVDPTNPVGGSKR